MTHNGVRVLAVAGLDHHDGRSVDGIALRAALRPLAAGVVIVTAPGPVGVTIASFASASLDPPLVSFFLGRQSATLPVLLAAGWFGIHILTAEQRPLAERFATRGIDRFAPPTDWSSGPHGVPVLPGCLARLTCQQHALIPLGDHYLIAGLVVTALPGGGEGPCLVHRNGRLDVA